jgi:hypothetical protein
MKKTCIFVITLFMCIKSSFSVEEMHSFSEDQLQLIATNKDNDEKQRFEACQILWERSYAPSQKMDESVDSDEEQDVYALFLNTVHQPEQYLYDLVNDIALMTSDPRLKEEANDLLWSHSQAVLYADLETQCALGRVAKASTDDDKASALMAIWNDKSLTRGRAKIYDLTWEIAEKGTYLPQIIALNLLFDNPAIKKYHYDRLIDLFMHRIRQTNYENKYYAFTKLTDIQKIWQEPNLKQDIIDELTAILIDIAKNSKDISIQYDVLGMLWYDSRVHNAEEELKNIILNLLQKRTDIDEVFFQKFYNLKNMSESEFDKACHKKLNDILLDLFRNAPENDQEGKSYYLKLLWKDPQAQKDHFAELLSSLLSLFHDAKNEKDAYEYLTMIWNNPKAKEENREILISYILDIVSNSQGVYSKIKYLIMLWNDPQIKIEKFNILLPITLNAIGQLPYDRNRFIAIRAFWDTPEVKGASYGEIVALFFDFIEKSQDLELRIQAINILSTNADIVILHKELLGDIYQNLMKETPGDGTLKLEAYLALGGLFQDSFNEFVIKSWPKMHQDVKRILCQEMMNRFGVENPRIQELLLLYARDGSDFDALSVYANLLQKRKENYKHHPSLLEVRLNEDQKYHFTLNQEIFSYLPITQEALASLEDVDSILGDDMHEVQAVRDASSPLNYGSHFKDFFTLPFTEEAIMLQAMIQKFKKMGPSGKDRLIVLMMHMEQCKHGKNQAIWDHYLTESRPLFLADLKNCTNWIARLQEVDNKYILDEEIYATCRKTRAELVTLLKNMLKKDHIFGAHLRILKTENAHRLRALLGSIANKERLIPRGDREKLGETLKQALEILVELSLPETFHQKLDFWCDIHDIYPPANKFGDYLTPESLDALIQKLKPSDVEGRGHSPLLQEEMRAFVKSPEFQELLHAFNGEAGEKFRELLGGFVSNGWSVGLLNLMILARDGNLKDAVNIMFDQVTIDKDMPLTWANLKKLILRELADLKRHSIHNLVHDLTGFDHMQRPHDAWYIESLIGGHIGLNDVKKTPDFDVWNEIHENVTSKSLQEMLDLFYEDFTPVKIADHLNKMISENKLSIIDPETGANIIWTLLSSSSKEQLRSKNIDDSVIDVDELLYNTNGKGATQFALALFLSKLGILREVDLVFPPRSIMAQLGG